MGPSVFNHLIQTYLFLVSRIFKGRKSTEVGRKDRVASQPSEAFTYLERKVMYMKIYYNCAVNKVKSGTTNCFFPKKISLGLKNCRMEVFLI